MKTYKMTQRQIDFITMKIPAGLFTKYNIEFRAKLHGTVFNRPYNWLSNACTRGEYDEVERLQLLNLRKEYIQSKNTPEDDIFDYSNYDIRWQ